MRLVQQSVRKLVTPASGNRVAWDSTLPGFGVRVTTGGAVSFVLSYRIYGRKRRYTVGGHPAWMFWSSATPAKTPAFSVGGEVGTLSVLRIHLVQDEELIAHARGGVSTCVGELMSGSLIMA